MDRLRVATLNIWNRSGPWAERCELIRAGLAELGADIVGLQEVLRLVDAEGRVLAGSCQAEELARAPGSAPGYHVAFGTATDLGSGLCFGNALLSRFAVEATRVIALPTDDGEQRRSILYARVATPAGALPVFVTHLHWKLHHGSRRIAQVRTLVDTVFDLAPLHEAALPPVILGDFNAEPDSDEIRFLRGLATIDGRSVYFADAWAYGGDGGPGYTFDRKNPFAAQAHEPPRRIDYVFVRGPDAQLRGEPVSTRLCFDRPSPSASGVIYPSDHFGVTTDLIVAPRER